MVTVSKFYSRTIRQGAVPSNPGNVDQPDAIPPVLNPPGSGDLSSYLTLIDTKDSTYVGKNGFVPVVTNEDGLTLMPIQNSEKDGLISGGVVQWTGSVYDFNVSSALARFMGVYPLNSDAAVLSLTTPDATNDRIDLFILQILFDGDGIPNGMEADFITGTPAGSPVKPQIDPATQIELTQVTVTAASSTPTLTEEVIYDENIEWTGSSSGTGTVAFNSASNPFQGSLAIEATNIQNGLKIRLTDGSDYDLSGVQTVGFQLDLKAQMFAGQNIGVTFLDSTGAAVSNELVLTFDKVSTDYQFVGIALSQFSFTSLLARSIEFRYIRTKGATVHAGFFLDIIKLEGGINPPVIFDGILGEGTANEIAYFTGPKAIGSLSVMTYPSLAELAYVKGVTSAIQTQLNGKQATIAGTLTNGHVATVVAGVPTWAAPAGGSSNWTVVGSDIYRNSSVMIGSSAAPSARLHVVGAGSATSGQSMGFFDSGASPTAGNLYGIGIGKTGVGVLMLGINKNSTTGSVPSGSMYITGYLSTSTLSIGRGNNSGLPSTADIFIGSTGLVGINTNNPSHGLDVNGNSRTQSSISSITSYVSFLRNSYNNFDVNPTVAYPLLRLDRAGKSGSSYESAVHFGISRFENVGNNARTELVISLNYGGSANPDRDILKIRSSAEFIYYDGSSFNTGTTTGLKIGTATSQKLAFWNKTPIIQPTTAITGATLVSNLGTPITSTDTFGGYTIAQLAAILINTGLTA